MTEPETVEEFVVVDAQDVPVVMGAAARSGVYAEEVRAAGLEPVSTVALLLVGSVTAVATVSHLVEQHRGGQVVDLRRRGRRAVYRSRDVVYGLVVVITETGVVRVEVHEPKGMFGTVCEAVVARMGELATAAPADVAKEIETRFGPDGVTVTVEDEDSG